MDICDMTINNNILLLYIHIVYFIPIICQLTRNRCGSYTLNTFHLIFIRIIVYFVTLYVI